MPEQSDSHTTLSELTEERQRSARLEAALRQIEETLTDDAAPEAIMGNSLALAHAALAGDGICGSRYGTLICGKPAGHKLFCGGEGIGWGECRPEDLHG